MTTDFDESLRFGNGPQDPPWRRAYDVLWPGHGRVTDMRADGEWQRRGIDVIVEMPGGRVLYVDEKHRSRDYGDLLLEIFSDFARRTCSWLTGPAEVTTHLAQVTPGMCTVVDFRALRRAWDWHGGRWLEDGWAHSSYRDVEEWIASAGPSGRALIKGRGGCAMVLSSTENRYHTLSVAVSWDRLNADAGIRPLRAAWKIPVDSVRSRV